MLLTWTIRFSTNARPTADLSSIGNWTGPKAPTPPIE